jgi:hypothetical protein
LTFGAAIAAAALALSLGSSGPAAPAEPSSQPIGVASATLTAGKPELLLANMTPLRASDIHVTGSGASRRLRFETALANIGRGPMEVRPNPQLPCPRGQRGASQVIYRDVDGSGRFRRAIDTAFHRRKAGCMVFHPTHNHWHMEASSFYALRPAGAKTGRAAAYRKTSFCLRDSERVPKRLGTFNAPLFYGACSRDRRMGVNVGWSDVYQSFLDGQSLLLGTRARVPNGRYCLSLRVDPKDTLRESNEGDNLSQRAIRIRGKSVTILPRKVCG